MGPLRTISGAAGQEIRAPGRSRALSLAQGAAGAVFRPLCLGSLRPGHSWSCRAVPSRGLRPGKGALRAPSGPPLGMSPSQAVPQPTRFSACRPASPTQGGP